MDVTTCATAVLSGVFLREFSSSNCFMQESLCILHGSDQTYFEGQGYLVSILITPDSHITTPLMPQYEPI